MDPFTGQSVIAAPDAYDNWIVTTAGLGFATARDLVQFALTLIKGGGSMLSPASAQLIQAPHVDLQIGYPAFYGYGVIYYPDYRGVHLYWHTGGIHGWTASLIWVPELDFAASVVFNGMGDSLSPALCALESLHELSDEPPPDTTSDPDTWVLYEGTYRGRFYGHWAWKTGGEIITMDGEEIEATFDKLGNQLVTQVSDLSVVDPLTPIGLDNFHAGKLLNLIYLFDLTFVDDPAAPGPSKWMRNRSFVPTRGGP